MDDLPEHIKVAVHFFFKTANEFAVEVAKKQGRDMTAMLKDNWQRFLESYLQEAEWIATAHVPTFNEYIKNARRTTGMCIINLISVLLMGELLPNNILEQIHYPSKIQKLIELTSRLIDDLQDFEDEKDRGEMASSIGCYIKDNPDSTVENSYNQIEGFLHLALQELNWEFHKEDSVPLCCKKFTFNIIRGVKFIFRYGDGLSVSNKEVKDQIFKLFVDQVAIEE